MNIARVVLPLSDKDLLRFHSSYDTGDGCWIWKASKFHYGYGRFNLRRQGFHAHRVAYTLINGEVDRTLVLDHLCRNRACVNPSHLEVVTLEENVRRGIKFNSTKTHCKRGHELNAENCYVMPGGMRNCLICRRANSIAYNVRRDKGLDLSIDMVLAGEYQYQPRLKARA